MNKKDDFAIMEGGVSLFLKTALLAFTKTDALKLQVICTRRLKRETHASELCVANFDYLQNLN